MIKVVDKNRSEYNLIVLDRVRWEEWSPNRRPLRVQTSVKEAGTRLR